MSKNFELLLQIGTDEELFGTVDESNEDEAILEAEPSIEAGIDARERILRNSSLPDVFQTVDEQEFPEPKEGPELGTDLSEDSALRRLQGVDSPLGTEPSESQSSPSTDETQHSIEDEKRGARGSTPKRDIESVAFNTSSRLEEGEPASFGVESREFFVRSKTEVPFGASLKRAPSFQWVAGLRTVAKAWRGKLQARNNYHSVDLATIAHEEEVKLIERVFPGTDQDSPRVVLFGGIEDEAQSAQVCARAG